MTNPALKLIKYKCPVNFFRIGCGENLIENPDGGQRQSTPT